MSLQSEVLVNTSRPLSDAELSAIELFKEYPDGLLKFAMAACLIIMLIGIPGNIITILALARYKKSLTSVSGAPNKLPGHWYLIRYLVVFINAVWKLMKKCPYAIAASLFIGVSTVYLVFSIIVIVGREDKVLNATAIFIINLSCSNLLFCFYIPLAASVYHHRAWVYGQILCQISLFARYTLFINSFFSILAITINRYIIIAHPKSYRKIYKKRNNIIMLVCTWIFSIVSIIPIVFKINGHIDVDNESCSSQSQDYNKIFLKKVIYLIAFTLTCTSMIFCYARIFCIVRNATKSNKKSLNTGKRVPNAKESSLADAVTSESKTTNISSRNTNTIVRSPKMEKSDNVIRQPEKMQKVPPRMHRTKLQKSIKFLKLALPTRKDSRLGTMILAIIISFCLCHLPIVIIKVSLTKNLQPKLNIASHILLFLSFSINPLIYVVISKEYRKAYKNLFKRRNNLLSLSKTKVPM